MTAKVRIPSKRSAATVKFEKPGDALKDALYIKGEDTIGDYGPTRIHFFQTKEGMKKIYAKQASQLSEDLLGLEGKELDIVFESLKPSKKPGFQPSKVFGIFETPNFKADSAVIAELSTAAEYANDEPETDVDADEGSEYEASVPAPRSARPAAPASTPDAERQAKVKALLASRSAPRA